MDELITSFKAQMYEKARSPFLTAFMVSWVSWNLKTIIVLIGSGDVETKLNLLDGLYTSLEDYVWHWILYPLLSASAFIFVYPLIALIAFSYWNLLNNLIKKIQVSQDDKVPTTAEDARKLRKLISEVSIEKQKVIDDLVDKNSELMQKDDSTNNLIAQLESEKRDLSKDLESKDLIISDYIKSIEELKVQVSALTKDRTDTLTHYITEEEKDLELSNYIKSLNVSLESITESEREGATKLINAISRFQKKYDIKPEQLELLMYLLVSKGRVTPQMARRNLNLEEIKLNAIIGTLQKKKLIENDVFGESVELTSLFRNDIYEFGVLSVPNYMDLISKIFF